MARMGAVVAGPTIAGVRFVLFAIPPSLTTAPRYLSL